MYDDGYRNRFTSVPAATNSAHITASPDGGDVLFTHIHNHKDFEILLIKSGKARFKVDGCDFLAEAGDVILVNPYEIHSSFALADYLPLSFFCVTFDLSLLSSSPIHPAASLCEKLGDGAVKFEHLIRDKETEKLFSDIEKLFDEKQEGWEFFVSSNIFRIFGKLIKDKKIFGVSAPTKNNIFTKEVQKYIEENFSENITSGDAARALSYDNSYFCRLFRKNFGQSFGEYLNFYRINFAKELLGGGSSVSKAALSSGFNNLSYFTKIFKKYNFVLPSEYAGRI